MNVLLAVGVFALGSTLGALANLAIYRLAYWPRPWSPWNPLADRLAAFLGGKPCPWPWLAEPARRKGSPKTRRQRHQTRTSWQVFVPVLGWFVLRHRQPWKKWPQEFTPRFWVRGVLIELGMGLLALWWLSYTTGRGMGMLPLAVQAVQENWSPWGTWIWGLALFFFLVVASGIDLDEWTIPDAVTVPGTLLALGLAVLCPQAGLPVPAPEAAGGLECLGPFWPETVQQGLPPGQWSSLGMIWACAALWSFALVPRRWYPRRGLRFALWFFFARMITHRTTRRALVLFVGLGIAGTALWHLGGVRYAAWLRALLGLSGAILLTWSVRVATSLAMQREALGFGDVTLMGMIGAYLGWQMAVVVFFVAPLAALTLVVLVWVLFRSLQRALPYGPALCLAAGVLVGRWAGLWQAVSPIFLQVKLVMLALAVCLPAMVVLLLLIRAIRWCCGRGVSVR